MNPISTLPASIQPFGIGHLTLNDGQLQWLRADDLDDFTYLTLRPLLAAENGKMPGYNHFTVAVSGRDDGVLISVSGLRSQVSVSALAPGPDQADGLWNFITSLLPNGSSDHLKPPRTPWLASVFLPAHPPNSAKLTRRLLRWQSLLALGLLRLRRESPPREYPPHQQPGDFVSTHSLGGRFGIPPNRKS